LTSQLTLRDFVASWFQYFDAMAEKLVTAYVALGANLQDRRANIERAIDELNRIPTSRVVRMSSLIENVAIGGPEDSPDFLNGAAEIETTLPPRDLLHQLHEIERKLGRERREKWGPRIIDLDLLLYGKEIIETDELTVPHPLMHTRQFVLQPLAEIAPTVVHPVLHRTVHELLAQL
jgi:2-amino-4-hydroxy-6-hydroxymethyldihydropteridine diphosphokinase